LRRAESAGVFTVYVKSSAGVAKDVFTKVKAFFERLGRTFTPVAGLGDDADLYPGSALHVLKGNMHGAVQVTPVGGAEYVASGSPTGPDG